MLLAAQPITDELESRLENDLSERDVIAVGTAIGKAIVLGIAIARNTVDSALRQRTPPIEIEFPPGMTAAARDVWADRYGA
jgi:hypothetical protein